MLKHNALKPNPENQPHRRFNLLTGEWILVSPHRMDRTWTGQHETPGNRQDDRYDPGCDLCPGNRRASGQTNPMYTQPFVFTDDFSVLLPDTVMAKSSLDVLLQIAPESGLCRVICYTPRHDLTMARMTEDQIRAVIDVWLDEFNTLGQRKNITYIQIFEDKGEMMGGTNPHPHGKIWASSSIPNLILKEDFRQQCYMQDHDRCLLCDYLERELNEEERIVFANDSFVCLVPFWAIWPFETMILPRRHMGAINFMNEKEKTDLAGIIRQLGICYDNLFETSFPYSMGIHQQPIIKGPAGTSAIWHFHFHYYPPLLHANGIKKQMAGYEILAMPQRDITPEQAAGMLRSQDGIHYLEKPKNKRET
ncbi:UDP-glucose--hexose-1-phosphate uridylyltransferase [uncultured Desulfobacter sp.]|uniref:UDP-glucose--hexose-1-phosphate uridylyltransferase n=1 Tax=uncultured Desulfobacter sp. TaxID=240139 RepID=UPI002AA78386|nr:UDP-glucose--hexose-1-phosphate uridylyltransferase [uncultured Desulfobacter sp.]